MAQFPADLIIDMDDTDEISAPMTKLVLNNKPMEDYEDEISVPMSSLVLNNKPIKEDEDDLMSNSGSGNSGEDDDDGLGDIWREMNFALQCSKDSTSAQSTTPEQTAVEEGEKCDHSFLLNDDLGNVCTICGVIEKSIETIFDYQWVKAPHYMTYEQAEDLMYEKRMYARRMFERRRITTLSSKLSQITMNTWESRGKASIPAYMNQEEFRGYEHANPEGGYLDPDHMDI